MYKSSAQHKHARRRRKTNQRLACVCRVNSARFRAARAEAAAILRRRRARSFVLFKSIKRRWYRAPVLPPPPLLLALIAFTKVSAIICYQHSTLYSVHALGFRLLDSARQERCRDRLRRQRLMRLRPNHDEHVITNITHTSHQSRRRRCLTRACRPNSR